MDGREAEGTETTTNDRSSPSATMDSNLSEDSSSNCKDLDLLNESRKQFHLGRKIAIKNIPVTTNEEVDLFLGEYELEEINMKSEEKEAVVTLKNGKDAESIFEELNQARMLDHTITISILATDRLLCIAHLPLDFTDKELRTMVYPLGTFLKCFMFRADDTGQSKGYGLVEFKTSLERTKQIAEELDWREVQGHKINCDVISQQTSSAYQHLHSRCLLVDNLPLDYKDNSHFREIFSCHASPIYCQVVLKEGEPLGFGIIEYADPKDAQTTQKQLNGYKLQQTTLRVTYCIPGKSAVEMCSKLLVKFDEVSSSKPSLLPDPIFPNPSVLNHPLVLDLCDQHTQLMTHFKTALHQLQQTYVTQMNLKSSKPGLLGPAPSIGMSPLMNPNMQLGLIILLALQTQARSQHQVSVVGPLNLLPLLGNQQSGEKPSILGDPVSAQANIILQNLMSQLSPSSTNSPTGGSTGASKSEESSTSPLLQSLAFNIQNLNLGWLTNLGQLSSSAQFRQQLNAGIKPLMKAENKHMPPPLIPPNFKGHFDRDMTKSSSPGGLLGEAPRHDQMKMSHNFMNNIKMLVGQKKIMQSNETPSLLDGNFSRQSGQGSSGHGRHGPSRYSQSGYRQSGYDQHSGQGGDRLSADHYSQGGGDPSGDGYVPSKQQPNNQATKGIKSLLGEPPSLVPKRLPSLGDGLLPEPGRGSDYGAHQDSYPTSGQSDYKRKTYDDQSYGGRTGDNSSKDDSGYGGYSRYGSTSYDNYYSDSSFNSGRADSSFNSQSNSSLLSRSGSTSYDKGYDFYQQQENTTSTDSDYESMAAKAMAYAAATNTGYQGMMGDNNGYYNSDGNYDSYTSVKGGNYGSYSDNGVDSDKYRQYTGSSEDMGSYAPYNNNSRDSYKNDVYQSSQMNRQNDKSSLLGTPKGRAPLPRSRQGVPPTSNTSVNPLLSTPGGGSQGLLATPGGSPQSLLSAPGGKSSSPHPLLSTPPGVSAFSNTEGRQTTSLLGDKPRYVGGSSGKPYQSDLPGLLGSRPSGAAGLLKTPVGQKRSYSHLLPAPEPSPETEYIGQHSQGIGGHYADSYSSNKRQRLDAAGASKSYISRH
ncbi:ribonucleoprotein PTB-binding 1-like [Ylistrum balloti]|uniref:ribonucleoprotein PTB-binding 1-like n=1 Tax=Ylistrum balloti TaxID=509963 RepID=UPI002905C14C|nr:ribonucleoprotein PTB-binding 1-like [Ylistrum balloti]